MTRLMYGSPLKSTQLGANTTAPQMLDALIERATGGRVISV